MPALGGRQFAQYSFRDHTGETGSFRFYTGEITAVSIAGLLTALGTLQTALDALTLGVRAKQSWGEETIVSNDTPADQTAQREMVLRVSYRGATTQAPYTAYIPTVDPTKLNFVAGGGDAVIFSGGGASAEVAAFVAAFEAVAKSPDDETEAVEITELRFVGQSS
jgi:hypothetical protein